jgi:hypothetical protein
MDDRPLSLDSTIPSCADVAMLDLEGDENRIASVRQDQTTGHYQHLVGMTALSIICEYRGRTSHSLEGQTKAMGLIDVGSLALQNLWRPPE